MVELIAHMVSWDFPVNVEDRRFGGSAGGSDDDPAGQRSGAAGPRRHRTAGEGPAP